LALTSLLKLTLAPVGPVASAVTSVVGTVTTGAVVSTIV
jgi:hypothetical protein